MQNQNIHSWPWGQGPGPAFQGAQSILPTNFPPPGVDQNSLLPGYQPMYGNPPAQPPPGYNQWTAAQLQQWQQWQQWQEKYQQWQAQYGKKYAESLAALGQNPGLLIPGIPPLVGVPKPVEPVTAAPSVANPPLPTNTQPVPPPPPDEEKPPLPFSAGENPSLSKTSNRTAPDNPEELSEAEKTFDIQFKQWEGQFNEWKKQNQNHPDKAQYREYEKKWETWREQLLQRREQMRKKRINKCAEQTNDGRTDESRPKPVPPPATAKPTNPECSYKTRPGGESEPSPASFPSSATSSQSSMGNEPPKFENKEPFYEGKPQNSQSGPPSVGNFGQQSNFLQDKPSNRGPFPPNSFGGFGPEKQDPGKQGGSALNNQNSERNHGPGFSAGSDRGFGNQGPNSRFENFQGGPNDSPFNARFRNPGFEGPRGCGNFDGNFGPRHRFMGGDGRSFGPPRFPGNERDNFNQQRFPGPNRERNMGCQNLGPQENAKPFGRGANGNDLPEFRGGNPPPDMQNLPGKPKVPSLFDITVEKPPGLGGPINDRKPKIWEKYEKDDYFEGPFEKRQDERDPEKTDKPWMTPWPKRDGASAPSPWMQPWEIEKLSSQKPLGQMRPWDRGGPPMENRPWLSDSPAKKEIDKAELSGYVGNILAKLGNFNVMPSALAKNDAPNDTATSQTSGNGSVPSLSDGNRSTNWDGGAALRSKEEQNMPKNNLPPVQSGGNNFRNQGPGGGPKDIDQRVECGDRLRDPTGFPPTNFDHLDESRKDPDERMRFDSEGKNLDVDERLGSRDDRSLFRRDERPPFVRDDGRNFPRPPPRDDQRNFGNEPRFFGRDDRAFGRPGRDERNFGRFNNRDDVDERFGGRNGRRSFDRFDRDDRDGKFFGRMSGSFDRFGRTRDPNEPVWNPQVFDYSQGRPQKVADPEDGFKISTVVDYSHGEKKQTFDYGHGEVTKDELDMRSFDYGHKTEMPSVIDYGHGVDIDPLSKDCKRERPPRDGDHTMDDRSKQNPGMDSPLRRSRSPRGRLRSHSRSPHSRFKKDSDSPPFRGDYKGRDRLGRPIFKRDRNGSEDKLSPADGDQSRHSFDVTTVLVEDLICLPGRETRPNKLVFIMRGLPGSGKTYVTKLIKDKEVELGVDPPRILSLDDYFMTEVEKEMTDKETGRKVKTKVMEYEYEAGMEPHYRGSLLKAFKKTVSDGFFSFIIVDSVNEKTKDYEEMWSFAKQKGFQVYVAEMDNDVTICKGRNIHKRTEKEISDLSKAWEETPSHYLRLDVRSLLQSDAITEVEMEVVSDTELEKTIGENDKDNPQQTDQDPPETPDNDRKKEEEDEDEPGVSSFVKSRWDHFENSEQNLDRLDGLKRRREGFHATMEEYLQLPDELDSQVDSGPGKKRVRWADLEERRQQEKMRAIGFVVGQTDWNRMTDPTFGENALTRTKYI